MEPITVTAQEAQREDEKSGAQSSARSDWMEIIKARLTTLVMATTLVGFYMAQPGAHDGAAGMNYWLLLHAMLGTALVASGAAALNQLIERKLDAMMHRTRNRPLPGGRLSADEVMLVGFGMSVAGIIYLAVAVNLITSVMAATTLVAYLFIYTPAKRWSSLNTLIGAVPGALPPVIGWAAVRGEASVEAWLLFAIVMIWQMPHFLAIAWLYREDYGRAGFKMLSTTDASGLSSGRQAVIYSLGLIPVSMMPTMFHMCSLWYAPIALVLGSGFAYYAFRFAETLLERDAKKLFIASVCYLPLLMSAMAFFRVG